MKGKNKEKFQTAERVSEKPSDNFVFQRSKLAYCLAAEKISGKVLEIGTGEGYGAKILQPKAEAFFTIDRYATPLDPALAGKIHFTRAKVPPIPFADKTFDFVVSFQVIEHVYYDRFLIQEIWRVLKPGGKLLISTPNRNMSLTRNPFHVREYDSEDFSALLWAAFRQIESGGIAGNQKVMEYYEQNRQSVAKFARFDILDLQHRLPRQLFKIPYDILNRINRTRLLKEGNGLVESIRMEDYFYTSNIDNCFDLFYTATRAGKSSMTLW